MGWSCVYERCGASRRLVLAAASFVVAVALLAVWLVGRPSMSRCEREVRYGDRKRGIAMCHASFEQTGNEHDLAWAARGHMYLGEADEADKLARRLLAGPLAGEAHGILSYLALRRGAHAEAKMHAMAALGAHTRAGDERGRTSDMFLLSLAELGDGDFRAALAAADEALELARRLHDVHTEVSVSLARADALRRVGDVRGALDTLTTAVARATEPCDRAWARLKSALCRMELGQNDMAMVDLTVATKANRDCANPDVTASISHNEAWLLRWADPPGALARLDELARSEGEQVETSLLRGYIAADRGDYPAAERYLARAAALDPLDADWPWVVERARAELSELRGGPLGDQLAEIHYRRAISMIAALRVTARARSAYFVSSHRSPYDGLIALLAREGRWRDVLAVVLDLDASDMLRATADDSLNHAPSLAASRPEASSSPTLPPSVDELLSAWRSRDLVIVIAPSRRRIGRLAASGRVLGHERAYRVRIAGGRVTGEDVGDASSARTLANDLFADPSDTRAAQALGRMIVPRDSAGGVLDVLAIGSLGKVPLAALRDDDGSLLVAKRPLARVLGLRAIGPDARGDGPPMVIANPTGDLPDATIEGVIVAAALGPGVQRAGTGTPFPATRARLFAARNATLWHIASHVSTLGRWRALRLADGDVDPSDIVQQRLAPRLAVLASCGSAAATDEEGWGSLAAALLESGTAMVIATDRAVGDAASLAMIREFYAQSDWRTDPARALARVQHTLDARATGSTEQVTKPRLWAAFSVLRRPPVLVDPP